MAAKGTLPARPIRTALPLLLRIPALSVFASLSVLRWLGQPFCTQAASKGQLSRARPFSRGAIAAEVPVVSASEISEVYRSYFRHARRSIRG